VPAVYQGKFCVLFSSLRDQMKSRCQTLVIFETVNVKKCTAMVQGEKMSLSLVQSLALVGLQAPAVTVEVHLANGLTSFTLVGLADVKVKEARERVRSALQNAGLAFPHNRTHNCEPGTGRPAQGLSPV
jgi:hypothetical protein